MRIAGITEQMTIRIRSDSVGGLPDRQIERATAMAQKRCTEINETERPSYQWSYAETERIDHRTVDVHFER